jgi:hypothetical protein
MLLLYMEGYIIALFLVVLLPLFFLEIRLATKYHETLEFKLR